MITKAETNSYRHRLRSLLSRLDRDRSVLMEEALRGTGGEASGGLSDVPVHMADLGTDAYEEEITLGLVESEEQLLSEIDAALVRLDEGTFGQCEACRQKISKARLQALPYARHCIRCAQNLESNGNP